MDISELKIGKLVRFDPKMLDAKTQVNESLKGLVMRVTEKGYDSWSRLDWVAVEVYGIAGSVNYLYAKPTCFEWEEVTEETAQKEFAGWDLPGMADLIVPCGLNRSGTDPEVFVTVEHEDSRVILPAFEFLPKKGEAGTVFWDGFQAEFTTPPAGCHAYLVDDIHKGLQGVLLKAKRKNPTAKLDCRDVMDIPPTMVMMAKDEHVELGCAPSRNCYGTAGIGRVEGRGLFWRTAGFHVHQSFEVQKNRPPVEKVIELVDAIAGVVMTSMLQGLEDSRRRTLYGRAGEYRTPKYGYEYRTLGSAVLWHPAVTHFALDVCRTAFQLGERGLHGIWKYDPEMVKDVVNRYDVKGCRKILKKNEGVLKVWLKKKYGLESGGIVKAMGVITKGVGGEIELNCEKNWKLQSGDYWTSHSEAGKCQFGKFVKG
jgi:hypothetical protein